MSDDGLVGNVCYCIPRRLFVALVAALWCFWYIGVVFHFMIWYPMLPSPPPRACTSHKCLEVLSCKGMQDATYHFRGPFLLLGGVIFGAFGLHGAMAVNHRHLKYFSYFLLAVTGIPNVPILEEKKDILGDLEVYPRRHVNWLVEHNVQKWYFFISLFYASVVLFCSHHTLILSRIYIDGPIGLGVNYRLNAWRNEVLLKHRIEEMEEELITGKTLRKDIGLNSGPEKSEKVDHLAAEGRHKYGAV